MSYLPPFKGFVFLFTVLCTVSGYSQGSNIPFNVKVPHIELQKILKAQLGPSLSQRKLEKTLPAITSPADEELIKKYDKMNLESGELAEKSQTQDLLFGRGKFDQESDVNDHWQNHFFTDVGFFPGDGTWGEDSGTLRLAVSADPNDNLALAETCVNVEAGKNYELTADIWLKTRGQNWRRFIEQNGNTGPEVAIIALNSSDQPCDPNTFGGNSFNQGFTYAVLNDNEMENARVFIEGTDNTKSVYITAWLDSLDSEYPVEAHFDNLKFNETDKGPCSTYPHALCSQDFNLRLFLAYGSKSDTEDSNATIDQDDPVYSLITERSTEAGVYMFFSPTNWEMNAKILNGCSLNDHYWLFAGASTNIQYIMYLVDLRNDEVYEFKKLDLQPAPATTATSAVPCNI